MLSEQNLFKIQSDLIAIVKNWSSGHKKKLNMIQNLKFMWVKKTFDWKFAVIWFWVRSVVWFASEYTWAGSQPKLVEEFPVGGEADNEGHVQTFGELPAVEFLEIMIYFWKKYWFTFERNINLLFLKKYWFTFEGNTNLLLEEIII